MNTSMNKNTIVKGICTNIHRDDCFHGTRSLYEGKEFILDHLEESWCGIGLAGHVTRLDNGESLYFHSASFQITEVYTHEGCRG